MNRRQWNCSVYVRSFGPIRIRSRITFHQFREMQRPRKSRSSQNTENALVEFNRDISALE